MKSKEDEEPLTTCFADILLIYIRLHSIEDLENYYILLNTKK